MELVTPELREQLITNGRNPDRDVRPAAKFFNAAGAGTWLITDANPDDPRPPGVPGRSGLRHPGAGHSQAQ